jgi:glycosyltransferase involved in cell wall biosynthesis
MKPQLSIAIPVYNQDIKKLVFSLQNQIKEVNASVEILVFDDGSEKKWKEHNRALEDNSLLIYKELPTNVGRAAIRNQLAASANAEHVLFLDGDSIIAEKQFLKTYLKEISAHPTAVICGGRNYPERCPGSDYSLHWHYGSYRESKSAALRATSPYSGFHSNNFVIPLAVWRETPFDESLRQYGNEDTLLGFELMTKKVEVRHIENATIHGQLESNQEFIDKTRLALQNLKLLYDRGNPQLNQWHSMLRRYEKLRKTGSLFLAGFVYRMMGPLWGGHLKRASEPSLRIFDLYRFTYLCSL